MFHPLSNLDHVIGGTHLSRYVGVNLILMMFMTVYFFWLPVLFNVERPIEGLTRYGYMLMEPTSFTLPLLWITLPTPLLLLNSDNITLASRWDILLCYLFSANLTMGSLARHFILRRIGVPLVANGLIVLAAAFIWLRLFLMYMRTIWLYKPNRISR